jgi:hypothetical protein
MAFTEDKIRLLAESAKLLIREIAEPGTIGLVSDGDMTWEELDTIVRANRVEDDLIRNIEIADAVFQELVRAFVAFHDTAGGVVVVPPTNDEIKEYRDKLSKLGEYVAADQRFQAAITFGGALADLVESEQV